MRHGGAFELRFMNWIFQIGAPNSKAALANPALQQALAESGRRIREHADSLPIRPGTTPLRVVPEYEAWLVEAMRSGPESPFWHKKGMSVVDHIADYADVPVLHITGWYDSWARQVTMNYEALSTGQEVAAAAGDRALGPRRAKLPTSPVKSSSRARPASTCGHSDCRWYDRWLKGDKNGVDDDPPVLLYIMGTGDDRRSPAGRLQSRRVLAGRARMAARASPGDHVLPGHRRHARRKPPEAQSAHTTYTFDPQHPVPTDRGQHLIEPGADVQRRL